MKIVLMKIQFSYQTKPLTLIKQQVCPQMINLQPNYVEKNRINDIFKEQQSFKDFQSLVENKLMKMEEAIISNCRCHSQTQRIEDEGDATPRFLAALSKNRITALENELSQKDAVTDYLTKQLVISTESNSDSNNNPTTNRINYLEEISIKSDAKKMKYYQISKIIIALYYC